MGDETDHHHHHHHHQNDEDEDEDPFEAFMKQLEDVEEEEKDQEEEEEEEEKSAEQTRKRKRTTVDNSKGNGNGNGNGNAREREEGKEEEEEETVLMGSSEPDGLQFYLDHRNSEVGVDHDDDDENPFSSSGMNTLEKEKEKDKGRGEVDTTLKPVNHDAMNYEPFNRQFYFENTTEPSSSSSSSSTSTSSPSSFSSSSSSTIATATAIAKRRELNISVSARPLPPAPQTSFPQMGFDRALLNLISKHGLMTPTPIQAQGIPTALSGHDMIGVAETGSGKTLAFLWPALIHVMDQRELEKGEGPIAVILAPTRELAHQIYTQAKRYVKAYPGLKTFAAYGGASKWEQKKALRESCEILVATPGRLIDLIRSKACTMARVTLFILDEADQMLKMGFEPQVRAISKQIRPDRQTLLFSATFARYGRVQKLATELLSGDNTVKLTVGTKATDEHISEVIKVLPSNDHKWEWLSRSITTGKICGSGSDLESPRAAVKALSEDKCIVFVNQKEGSEVLSKSIEDMFPGKFHCEALHGDKHQIDRSAILKRFKNGTCRMLIATDVAARGLDVSDLSCVINYDAPRDIDTYVHRIGRTGRRAAGQDGDDVSSGVAWTLLTNNDTKFARSLVKHLENKGVAIGTELSRLAGPGNAVQGTRNGNAVASSNSSSLGVARASGASGISGIASNIRQTSTGGRGSGRSDTEGKNARFVGIGFAGTSSSSFSSSSSSSRSRAAQSKGPVPSASSAPQLPTNSYFVRSGIEGNANSNNPPHGATPGDPPPHRRFSPVPSSGSSSSSVSSSSTIPSREEANSKVYTDVKRVSEQIRQSMQGDRYDSCS